MVNRRGSLLDGFSQLMNQLRSGKNFGREKCGRFDKTQTRQRLPKPWKLELC